MGANYAPGSTTLRKVISVQFDNVKYNTDMLFISFHVNRPVSGDVSAILCRNLLFILNEEAANEVLCFI